MGTHFKTSWDSKGMANSFGSGFPMGARAPCWLGNPKGTAFPWQEASNGGHGGFVAHDFVRKV